MSRAGFTLVELLVVSVVAITLLLGVMYVLSETSSGVWMATGTALEAQTRTQRALDIISDDVRQSLQVSVAAPAQQRPRCAACPGGFTGTCLWIARQPIGGPTVLYGRDAGNMLLQQVGAAAATVVANEITVFSPTCNVSSGMVDLQLTALVAGARVRPELRQQTLRSRVWVKATGA